MSFEELLISKGKNPKNFHKEVGIDRRSIAQYRRGTNAPNFKNAAKIAKALDMTVEELVEYFDRKME